MTYLKAHLQAVFAVLVAVVTSVQSAGHIDRANIVQVSVSVAGVLLAYVVHNTAGGVRKYAQAIISSLVVVGQVAGPYIVSGHITYPQVIVALVAVVQGVVVFWASETAASTVSADAAALGAALATVPLSHIADLTSRPVLHVAGPGVDYTTAVSAVPAAVVPESTPIGDAVQADIGRHEAPTAP